LVKALDRPLLVERSKAGDLQKDLCPVFNSALALGAFHFLAQISRWFALRDPVAMILGRCVGRAPPGESPYSRDESARRAH